ncbi:MAG: hypothetical protein HZB42_01125 [Sphingobacteriales bacterium]|nr:hypothetical protein [Sphingobacteriales bacterium]
MKTIPQSSQPSQSFGRQSRPVLTQIENNTTLWVGNLKQGVNERIAGQTFTCPSEGLLNNIQVFSSAVTRPGELQLTLHEFDASSRTWGPAIADSKLTVDKDHTSSWLRFELEPVQLKKNVAYGFRLHAPEALIGLGEAAREAKSPFNFGMSWNGNNEENAKFFHYFSLAFKVELCA